MSEMEKYLFVGGKADGHMIMLNRNHHHHQIPYLDAEFSGEYHEHTPVKAELYRKIKWESGDREIFEFFALESLSNSEVMSIILNNYKPKQEVRENKLISEMKFLLNECISMLNFAHPYITIWSDSNMISKHISKIHKFLNLNKN